jgi:hypothetical protein
MENLDQCNQPPSQDSNQRLSDYEAEVHALVRCGRYKRYPKVSGLAAWSENSKWYSSLPLGAVVSLFYESV